MALNLRYFLSLRIKLKNVQIISIKRYNSTCCCLFDMNLSQGKQEYTHTHLCIGTNRNFKKMITSTFDWTLARVSSEIGITGFCSLSMWQRRLVVHRIYQLRNNISLMEYCNKVWNIQTLLEFDIYLRYLTYKKGTKRKQQLMEPNQHVD